jgi:3'-5' exonuclease
MQKQLIFLDIETVPYTNDYESLSERMKANWARKATFLRSDVFEKDEKLYDTKAGIFAEFGRIICISLGVFNGRQVRVKSYFGHDEKLLLTEFCHLFSTKLKDKDIVLCAHNGKEFDFPYLCRRLLINRLKLPDCLQLAGKKPWEVKHLDTLELWKFGDYKHYISLDLLAAVFEIATSKDDIDGSQVAPVYYQEENGLERIKTYCEKDVKVLANVYFSLNSLPILADEDFVFV